jgi:hypothetical protein
LSRGRPETYGSCVDLGEVLTSRLTAAALGGLALCFAAAAPAAARIVSAPPAPAVRAPATAAAASNGAWTVYHHDNAHTGYDSTLPAATGATAGWVSATLDGSLYPSPLVYNGLVYEATLNNTVYALNQSTGAIVWSNHLRAPETTGWSCGNVSPQGILGTPVIDASGGRIYVTTLDGTDDLYRVEGLNLATGVEELNTVVTTPAPSFDWHIQQQRGALGLFNGYVYVPFGGRWGDCGAYHGFVFAVPINGGAVTNFYATPGQGAGFWSSGGVVVDNSTGKVFETSGNGTSSGCNANSNGTPVFENDAVVRLSATLAHEDAFIPQDWRLNWCTNDEDLGSASMVLISPTLAFQAGKWGNGFLVNPQALGGMDGQRYPTPQPAAYSSVDVCLGNHHDANFGSYAYAAPYVYLSCEGSGLVALQVNTSTPSFSSCAASCASPSWNAGGFTPGPPIVAGGAVWAVDIGGAGLYGFDAATGAQIYHSSSFGVTHFTTPSEAGGQIFVGSDTVVRSFNLILNACTSVNASAAPPSPSIPGTTVTISATSTGCPTPLYQFWTLAPGGSWTVAQGYSASATFSWNTTGLAPGTYKYSVWGRDATSPNSYDAFFPGTAYTLTATPPCTSVNASAAPGSPQPAGTTVTITATSTGCPNPRYEFWIQPPGGSWAVAQGYSNIATFSWNTTPPAGVYHWSVWARDAGSSAGYDVFVPGAAYTLTTTPCASANATAAPASPQASGTTITVSATSTGCANPRYEFWLQAPGGSWTIVQAYSSTATFSWNTSGSVAGSWHYSVWVRDASSGASYDKFFPGTAYTLTSTPCTSANASAAPASPQASGTTVTVTATSATCTHPLYEFWIKAPGGSWTIAQAYSAAATFSWNTAGLPPGTYYYSVWVRDSGSSAAYDTYFPGTAYTLT